MSSLFRLLSGLAAGLIVLSNVVFAAAPRDPSKPLAPRGPAIQINLGLPMGSSSAGKPTGRPSFGRPSGDTPNLGGDRPILRIPGLPKDPIVPLVEAKPLTVSPAQLQVLRQDGAWATARDIVGLPVAKFRWSFLEKTTASARWELFQPIKYPSPQYQPGGHNQHGGHQQHGPTAVLIAAGDLKPLPALGAKQEFVIDLSKHLVGLSPSVMSEYRVRVVLRNAQGSQAGVSNEVRLLRQPAKLAVVSYERFKGNFDADSPPEDAFIRANIVNQGAAKYEGGGKYEFYATLGNNPPVLIGKGALLPLEAGATASIVATRPVLDWYKSAAQSLYKYECKLMP